MPNQNITGNNGLAPDAEEGNQRQPLFELLLPHFDVDDSMTVELTAKNCKTPRQLHNFSNY